MSQPETPNVTPTIEARVQALIAEGRTVEAIKFVRGETSCSLAEALRWVNEKVARSSPRPIATKLCPYAASRCGPTLLDSVSPAARIGTNRIRL
jgi:hypothetical protein